MKGLILLSIILIAERTRSFLYRDSFSLQKHNAANLYSVSRVRGATTRLLTQQENGDFDNGNADSELLKPSLSDLPSSSSSVDQRSSFNYHNNETTLSESLLELKQRLNQQALMSSKNETESSTLPITSNYVNQVAEFVSQCTILALGTVSMSLLLTSLLPQWEWLQAWRYTWPLIGILFIAETIPYNKNSSIIMEGFSLLPLSLSPSQSSKAIQISSLLGAIGLLIGGAYDAFMPVYETGPNVFTVAGIGQDGAVVLLVVSIVSILGENWKATSISSQGQKQTPQEEISPIYNSNSKMLLQILLLAQLYKLGESSIDEIITRIMGSIMLLF